jgi:glucoamylase
MGWIRAALALAAVVAAGALLVSGGSEADPRTPAGLPGRPPPFLGVAVVGNGGLTGAIDAYGDVVDLRPGPAGRALIDNSSGRQAAGTVPAGTGIVPWVSVRDRPARPLWRADSVVQAYRPGTSVLVTTARFGGARVKISYAAGRSRLACIAKTSGGARASLRVREPAAARRLSCGGAARRIVEAAARTDARWLGEAAPLGAGAPDWAWRLYRRSLLVLRALTDRRSGAVAAGARDGWAYVWPRDAATAALAYAAAGYRREAARVARFLLGLDLAGAARFTADGGPVPGRAAQGDPIGWVAAASRVAPSAGRARRPARILSPDHPIPWRERSDYQEGEPGDYLGNALAAAAAGGTEAGDVGWFSSHRLTRRPRDPESGLDSAAAWAVEPFPQPSLYAAARRTMLALLREGGRFGIAPGEAWPGEDPWGAPTAWTAWSLAALARREHGRRSRADRRGALRLLADLRRAATPAGALPERVDARSGVPRSTTPLAWPHAFAILALLELWPAEPHEEGSAKR